MKALLFSAISLVLSACALPAEPPTAPRSKEQQSAPPASAIDPSGTVHVPGFDMPFSSFASKEARELYIEQFSKGASAPRARPELLPKDIGAARKSIDDALIPRIQKQQARWPEPVDIRPWNVDGVYTEVFTPGAGVAPSNRGRVLINLHGGGFMVGARTHGQVESIPIAALAQIKVVSIDYRMAPEHVFPAASEDVATVYKALLKEYRPEGIGLYGCSAGGTLAAQAVAWFLDKGLPVPGAIGMFSGTGWPLTKGDSMSLSSYVFAQPFLEPDVGFEILAYFKGVDLASPLVQPMLSKQVLARFPPSLLITGGRAPEMSSVIEANNRLTLAGAKSRLHVWEGVGHCFLLNPDLPETRQAEQIIVDFFNENLAP